MKRGCCDGRCHQGRDCPGQAPIPTERGLVRRLLSAFWAELETNPWLPMAIAVVLLMIVNFPT